MSVYYTSWTVAGKRPQTHGRMIHARNVLTGGTVAAFNTATGYNPAAPEGWESYEAWQGSTDASGWGLTWGTDQTASALAIGAHTLGSTGSTVRVDTWDGTTWTIELAAVSPADDSPIMWLFDPVTARGFRVWVVAGDARPSLGVVKFGTPLEMEQPVFAGIAPARFSRNTARRNFVSESGETLGWTTQRTNLAGGFRFEHLSPEWVDAHWQPAMLALEEAPFFLAWRPDGTKTTMPYRDVVFGSVTSTPQVQTMGVTDLLSTSLDWTGPAYE